MESVRYKPGEGIRWLELGAQEWKKSAKKKGKNLVKRDGGRNLGEDVRDAASLLMGMGKGALADLIHRQAEASEYVFQDEVLEILTSGKIRSVPYGSVKSIRMSGDKVTLRIDHGSVTIKPHAYILSGRLKVPIGWQRNGIEVPYEIMLDELAARCNLEIEQAV